MKKTLYSILAATLIMSSSMGIRAQEVYPVLTLEKAIKDAKKTSITLEQNERQQKLKVEEGEYADLMYGYNAYEAKYAERRYTEKEQNVIEKQLERSVRQLFDSIIYHEQSLKLLDQKIALQEKSLKATQLKMDNGQVSALDMKQEELKLNTLKEDKKQLETVIQKEYAGLCTLIGETTKRYTLDKKDNAYEAFSFPGSIDALVSTRTEEHLATWQAKENIRIQDLPFGSYDYMEIMQKKESREQARDSVKLTEQALGDQIRTIYTNVKQLEKNYEMAQKALELKETEQRINTIYLEKGMLSQLDYEKKLLEYEQSKLELKDLINQHTDSKELLNRPYLIPIKL